MSDFSDKDRRRERFNRRKKNGKNGRPNYNSVKPWRGSRGPTATGYDNYREFNDNFSVDSYDDNE